MKIETKFDLGEVVISICRKQKRVQKQCDGCSGRGKITLDNKESRHCPCCYGRGHDFIYETEKWRQDKKLTLGKVSVSITESPGIDGEETFDNYKAQSDREERYMAVETGIGSGTLYYAEDMFYSENEAQAECDKRNKNESD